MKTLFSIFATILFITFGHAQKITAANLKIQVGKTIQEDDFSSFQDLAARADALLESALRQQSATPGLGHYTCVVSISITVNVQCGLSNVTITGSITVPCEKALEEAKRFRSELYQAAITACN